MTKACGAKTRAGTRCKRAAMPNGRCHLHGGKSLSGVAHPNFKTGRYSKYLPARLAGRYQEAAQDPNLLALREDIALLDSRIAEVVSRLTTGESGGAWKAVRAAYENMLLAKSTGDPQLFAASLNNLGDTIQSGYGDEESWIEISILLQQRRKLVESERKRLVDMQQMITAEQAMILVSTLVDILRRHVTERPVLAAISADITQLLARTDPGQT